MTEQKQRRKPRKYALQKIMGQDGYVKGEGPLKH